MPNESTHSPHRWLPRRWCFVLSGKGLKGRGVSFKIVPKIVAYKDKESLQRLWIKLGSRKRILWPYVKEKTSHCKIQIPRFCQQKEEYCSFPTKVAEPLTWIPSFSWQVDTLQKQQSKLNIKLFWISILWSKCQLHKLIKGHRGTNFLFCYLNLLPSSLANQCRISFFWFWGWQNEDSILTTY